MGAADVGDCFWCQQFRVSVAGVVTARWEVTCLRCWEPLFLGGTEEELTGDIRVSICCPHLLSAISGALIAGVVRMRGGAFDVPGRLETALPWGAQKRS